MKGIRDPGKTTEKATHSSLAAACACTDSGTRFLPKINFKMKFNIARSRVATFNVVSAHVPAKFRARAAQGLVGI